MPLPEKDVIADADPTPEGRVMAADDGRRLNAALAKLPEVEPVLVTGDDDMPGEHQGIVAELKDKMTAFAVAFPPSSVDAAKMQRTITPEYMCQGCDWRRILSVMRSAPAAASNSSNLPNAFTEYGQVGSRNASNIRGPLPQTRGSARHALEIMRSFPAHFCLRGDNR